SDLRANLVRRFAVGGCDAPSARRQGPCGGRSHTAVTQRRNANGGERDAHRRFFVPTNYLRVPIENIERHGPNCSSKSALACSATIVSGSPEPSPKINSFGSPFTVTVARSVGVPLAYSCKRCS